MSAKEPTGSRGYHITNMPRRDPISQSILNRIHGKHVDDEFASKLNEMNPETAKHFKEASARSNDIVNDLIPQLTKRLDAIEGGSKAITDMVLKRDKEINDKFDTLMHALAGLTGKPAAKKGGKKGEVVEDFQSEAEDDLPPSEK